MSVSRATSMVCLPSSVRKGSSWYSASVSQNSFRKNLKPDLESAWSKLSDHESSAAFRHFCKREGVFHRTCLNSLETELFFIAKRWHSNSQDTFYVILGEQNHQIIIFDDILTLNLHVKKISQLFSPRDYSSDCPANVPTLYHFFELQAIIALLPPWM